MSNDKEPNPNKDFKGPKEHGPKDQLEDNIASGLPPEPGTVKDPKHGLPGPPEALPDDDRATEETTEVNDPEDEEDSDDEASPAS